MIPYTILSSFINVQIYIYSEEFFLHVWLITV